MKAAGFWLADILASLERRTGNRAVIVCLQEAEHLPPTLDVGKWQWLHQQGAYTGMGYTSDIGHHMNLERRIALLCRFSTCLPVGAFLALAISDGGEDLEHRRFSNA